MKALITILLSAAFISANAQKLPNTQPAGLRLPANIKIDGKTTEWGDKLQAQNSAVELSYTLANDDTNLYLAVQADKPRIFEKIVAVGVTFTINKTGAKDYKANETAVITFPLLDVPTGARINTAAGIKSDNVIAAMYGPRGTNQPTKPILTAEQADSLKGVANRMLKAESKTLKLTGFTGLPDTLSIYNEHNIVTGLDYDKNGAYTYELQIPLKLLGLSVSQTKPFSYSIKLRSRLEDKKRGTMTVYKYDKDGNTINPNQDLDATTDFWGEYTLAK